MNSSIDITSEQRKTMVDLLRQYIPGVAVWAYGSRVKWTARPNSDLDLVVFTAPAQHQLVSELKNALAESELSFLVDLHVWDEIPERFREIIRGEYVVIQEQKDEPRQLSPGSDWRISTWGEEISLEYGKALRGYSSEKGEYRVYGSNGPIGWTGEPLAPGPGIILGRKGAYRGIQFCQEPFYVIDTAYYVVPKTELDMRWLYYAMAYYKLGEIDDGSPIPSTTRSAIYIREFEIPTPREQRNIAGILGALDDRIELNRKLNETLEAIARAIFKSWFVDFDPVRAKAEGRVPEGMDAATAALFPGEFRDSEIGEIPSGWKTHPVGDLATVMGGSTPSTKEPECWDGGEYAWATPKDLSSLSMPILLSTAKKITSQGLARISSGLLDPGTVLLSSRAPIGYLAIAEIPTAINQGFIAMKAKDGVSNLFLLFWTKASHEAIVSRANGSTFLEISKSAFRTMPVIVPSPEIMTSFDTIVRPLYEAIVNNEKQSRILADFRDTLLPRLISGKLRVPEAEAMLMAV